MKYNFYVLTKQGLKNHWVESASNFDCAPFGFVPYRVISTCQCKPAVIEEFWRCVDEVLAAHSLTSSDYQRAVRAYTILGELCGEFDPAG